MEKIKANVWGKQTEVMLGTWAEIKAFGFKKSDRAFGTLNNGQAALYFYKYGLGRKPYPCEYDWYLTTEKFEDIQD
jgi:hypothetical protein